MVAVFMPSVFSRELCVVSVCWLCFFLGTCSSSNPWHSRKPARVHYSCNKVFYWGHSRKRCLVRLALLEHSDSYSLKVRPVGYKNCYLSFQRGRRLGNLFPLASADDGVTVNGSLQASTNRDVEGIKVKLNQSLHGEDSSDALVQFLHEAARVFELAIKEQGSFSKLSWFSTAWLNGDNAWVKALSYQVFPLTSERLYTGRSMSELCFDLLQLLLVSNMEKTTILLLLRILNVTIKTLPV